MRQRRCQNGLQVRQRRCRDDIKLRSVVNCVAKCRGRTIRDYLIWNPLLPQVEHLTVTKMYVIIIPKRSGIYNIPIIPLVLTSTIFEKRKQEVNYCQERYAHSGLYTLLF